MTDLQKAKQYREQRFGTSPWMDTTDADKLLVAYASHSNSELLERVQKLEQQIDERLDRAWIAGALCGRDCTREEINEGIEARTSAIVKAKAPDTRNV